MHLTAHLPIECLIANYSTRWHLSLKGLSQSLCDTSFNKDLSNEPIFGRIHLAGQYKAEEFPYANYGKKNVNIFSYLAPPVRQRDSALRKVKQLERQLEEVAQGRDQEEGAEPDNDRRARLGRLEGENVLLRYGN